MNNHVSASSSQYKKEDFVYLGLLIFWFMLYVWPHVMLSTKSVCFYNQKFCKILPSLCPLHSHGDVTPTSMLYLKSKPVCVSSTHCQFSHPFLL